jgi:hypothetical protein
MAARQLLFIWFSVNMSTIFQIVKNQLLIFPFLENEFCQESNWISINLKIKHFQNSMNELWSFENALAYLKSIFYKIEFQKNLQCIWYGKNNNTSFSIFVAIYRGFTKLRRWLLPYWSWSREIQIFDELFSRRSYTRYFTMQCSKFV